MKHIKQFFSYLLLLSTVVLSGCMSLVCDDEAHFDSNCYLTTAETENNQVETTSDFVVTESIRAFQLVGGDIFSGSQDIEVNVRFMRTPSSIIPGQYFIIPATTSLEAWVNEVEIVSVSVVMTDEYGLISGLEKTTTDHGEYTVDEYFLPLLADKNGAAYGFPQEVQIQSVNFEVRIHGNLYYGSWSP